MTLQEEEKRHGHPGRRPRDHRDRGEAAVSHRVQATSRRGGSGKDRSNPRSQKERSSAVTLVSDFWPPDDRTTRSWCVKPPRSWTFRCAGNTDLNLGAGTQVLEFKSPPCPLSRFQHEARAKRRCPGETPGHQCERGKCPPGDTSVFFSLNVYFETERASELGKGRRERIPSRLRTVSTEPNAGLELRNCEIVARVETKSRRLNRLSPPGAPVIVIFSGSLCPLCSHQLG